MMGNVLWLLLGEETKGQEFVTGLLDVIVMIVTAAGALMTIYAIFLAYLFATASDENKRRTAKKRLFTVASSVFIVIALVCSLVAIKDTIDITRVSGGGGNGNNTEQPASAAITCDSFYCQINVGGLGVARKPKSNERTYGNTTVVNGNTKLELVDTQLSGGATFPASYVHVSGGTVERVTGVRFHTARDSLASEYWAFDAPNGNDTSFKLSYSAFTYLTPDSAANTTLSFFGDGRTSDKTQIFLYVEVSFLYKLGSEDKAISGLEGTVNSQLYIDITHSNVKGLTIFLKDTKGLVRTINC